MLRTISIKDFAIIDNLTLNLERGLNIFTGETGAGKSIIIEALGFVLGARGDCGLIMQNAPKMTVSAVFDSCDLPKNLKDKFQITGPSFTIRRELDQKAKSKASVDGKNILISDLSVLGSYLVDFHGQNEHQLLFKAAAHLDILDQFAGNEGLLSQTYDIYKKAQGVKAEIEALKMSEEEKKRMLDMYKYQLEEIEKLALKPNEDAEIESVLPKLKNAEKLKENAAAASTLLDDGENGAVISLAKAAKHLEDMAQNDAALEASSAELAQICAAVQEIASSVSSYGENIESDTSALDNLLGRQEDIRKMKLKYGPALEDVFTFAQNLKEKIKTLAEGEQNASKLEKTLKQLEQDLDKKAQELSKKRKDFAKILEQKVVKEITPLGFERVRFEADFQDLETCGPKGKDSVEFLFSSNPSQALRPLKNIASGGEISRLMLGLKTVLAQGTPVMVFDEIDTGISGLTGKLVGQKLKKVSAQKQVLCVTHLAQVAAFGDANFNIAKTNLQKICKVSVAKLENDNKVLEIARMIGSSKTASAGYKHAQDLIAEAQNVK
jgi:DNA repair protein RecN (Recombination protein N)